MTSMIPSEGKPAQFTLPFGLVEQGKDEIHQLLAEVGGCGGYISFPAHDIPADARSENIAAMIEVLRNQ